MRLGCDRGDEVRFIVVHVLDAGVNNGNTQHKGKPVIWATI